MFKKEEWPLLLFTLLSQLAIGAFTLLVIVNSFGSVTDAELFNSIVRPGIYMSVIIMALALLCSLFHLGTPLLAYMSIVNSRASWLSREILTAGGFFVLALAYAYTCFSGSSVPALGWLAVIMGLSNIYSMSSIYRASIYPAWTHFNTFIAFYGSAFSMGTIFAVVWIALGTQGVPLHTEIAGVFRIMLLILGVSLIIPLSYFPVFISSLYAGNTASIASARFLRNYSLIIVIRWLVSFTGFGIFLHAVMYQAANGQALAIGSIFAAASLISLGEIIGRYIFYAIAVPIEIRPDERFLL